MRLGIYLGLISFVIGFLGTLAGLEWFFIRVAEADTRWWEFLHFGINAILISVFCGLGLACASALLVNLIYRKQIVFHCPYCGKPLKAVGIYCDCSEAQAFRQKCKQ